MVMCPLTDNALCFFSFKIGKEISKTEYLIRKFQSKILLNNLYEFKPILSDFNIGSLVVKKDNISSEENLEGVINFEIDQFKSLKGQKIKKYDRNWCVIDNIRWTASALIEEDDNYIQHLEIHVEPDCDNLETSIETKLVIKLLKTNSESIITESFDYKFEDNFIAGFKNLCPLKEIFDPQNRIYNDKNDSIKMEIDIEVLKK